MKAIFERYFRIALIFIPFIVAPLAAQPLDLALRDANRLGEPLHYSDLSEFHIDEQFEPFSGEAESRHADTFQGLADLVTDRIEDLLDEPYRRGADAAAAAETTSVVSDTGAATNNVTGDTGTYVLGKTIAGGTDEVAKWLLERQSQSFDAVFVPAGTRIAIHVDRELTIDLDFKGRKLNHAKSVNPYLSTRLD